jgi:hypothetical protein
MASNDSCSPSLMAGLGCGGYCRLGENGVAYDDPQRPFDGPAEKSLAIVKGHMVELSCEAVCELRVKLSEV